MLTLIPQMQSNNITVNIFPPSPYIILSLLGERQSGAYWIVV